MFCLIFQLAFFVQSVHNIVLKGPFLGKDRNFYMASVIIYQSVPRRPIKNALLSVHAGSRSVDWQCNTFEKHACLHFSQ